MGVLEGGSSGGSRGSALMARLQWLRGIGGGGSGGAMTGLVWPRRGDVSRVDGPTRPTGAWDAGIGHGLWRRKGRRFQEQTVAGAITAVGARGEGALLVERVRLQPPLLELQLLLLQSLLVHKLLRMPSLQQVGRA